MNQISKILPVGRICADFEAASGEAVLRFAGELFERENGLPAGKTLDALLQREKLGSTGLGMGIAIPHQRIKGLKEPLGAFVRTREAVAFDAPDGAPVRFFFVLLVPEQANEAHLRLLAELAQMFSDRGFRESLAAAEDAPALGQVFIDWNLNASHERSAAL